MKLPSLAVGATIVILTGVAGLPPGERVIRAQVPSLPDEHEFVFVRVEYESYPAGEGWLGYRYRGRGRNEWWRTDFPEAEENFLRGVQRYTTLDATPDGHVSLALTDPALFEYPFLYINMKRLPLFSGNGPNFSQAEVAALREYLLRGGFLMVDDFWGPEHLEDTRQEFRKVFPGREMKDLDTTHSLFHCFYDIDTIIQAPGRGVTWNYGAGFALDDPEYPPACKGIVNDDGRVMVVFIFNSDLGDGWEHTFAPYYPTRYCNEAYKLGINLIVYALTH